MQILFHLQLEIFDEEVVTLKKEPLRNLALFQFYFVNVHAPLIIMH